MGKLYIYRFLLVLVLFLLAGCSTEKNTFMSRRYHNVTAHYNVYFNGKQSLKAGIEKINNSYEDDFSKVLPLYKSSNPSTATAASAEMENAVLKGSKLIQSHSITARLKRRKNQSKSFMRFAKREEFNNWVDDAYILMGKAYFYQHNYASAIENFSYVTRKFDYDPSRYTAYIWLIRSYTELERFVEAFEVIQKMQDDEGFPKSLEGELATVTADYYARQHSYTEGIPFLSIAVKKTPRKTDRIRDKYVLAQWYQETGNAEKASEIFREISRMNPPYKLDFNARINAAGTFSGKGDAVKMKKELQKMLRDKKNLEFRDQIYFALGNISLKEGNKNQAKTEYMKSASLSKDNLYQRGLSCLTLAQMFFEELEYKKSQAYYDSAMIVIDEKYPNFQQISARYKSLTRLTDNIYAVEREDSLQRIAKMDEPSRNALIDKWIKEVNDKEAKDKLAENSRLMNQSFYRQNESRFGLSQQQEGAGWYFYSPTTVAYGKVEFERLWGKRKLEDGWRRSNKRTESENDNAAPEDSLLTDDSKTKKITDPKNREFYTQNLPMNDSLMAVSHLKIRNSLFNAGRIFKTEFNDFARAIEAFVDLNKRYPDNLFALSSWFELWDLFTKLNNPDKAAEYKNLIIGKYPDSKFAKYLQNPNYFVELEARTDSINRMYQKVFLEFKNGKYAESGKIADQIILMKPDSAIIPKIQFFKLIADGTSSTRENFGKLLSAYVKDYPKAEPKPLAEQILKLIQDSTLTDYQKLVDSGYLSDKIKNNELLAGNQKEVDEFGGKYSYDEDLLHYFVIAYPKNANVDLNLLKFDLANYNIDHYTRIDFDIETQSLNANTNLLIVRSLNDKEQGLIYFRSIIKRRTVFEALKKIKYVNFIASSTNFRVLLADKDYTEYLKFFVKNYSRFVTGDFTDEILPEPEVLLAKAKQEEETLKEKGSFVTVTPTGSGLDIYSGENTGVQNFVIAVNSPGANLKQVIAGFNAHNRDQYNQLNLSIRQSKIAEYQLMIVSSFKSKIEAINYFTKAITTRKLYRSLDTLSYRNFIITDGNLRKLTETRKINEYLNYFKARYIELNSDMAVKQDQPEYTGPYKTAIAGKQTFVLVVPKEEVNETSIVDAIRQFNQQNFKPQNLTVTSGMLDDFRLIIKVDGLADVQSGIAYLRSIANEPKVFGPIQNANYRNFVITPENEKIFRGSRNILTYMEFYKQFYLK